jgi:Tol biopolymer transport system component
MPRWSPDGREIAYYTFGPDLTRQVRVVPSGGGSSRGISDVPRDQRSPSWSPDGRSLVFSSNDGEGPQRLYLTSRDGAGEWGPTRSLATAIGEAARWSPNGREIAYAGPGGIWAIDPDGRAPRPLLQIDHAAEKLGNLEWWQNGGAILYKWFDAGGRASFWSVASTGADPQLVLQLDDRLRAPRPEFASDGARVYFTVAERESDIWTMELTGVRR